MSTAGGRDDVAELVLSVYEIHDEVIGSTGGMPGLRDAQMLHAACARPFATFGGQPLYETPFEQAAALFHSLIKSHPFMDGTKRTALLSALWFLRKTGQQIPTALPRAEVVAFCLDVAEESLHPDRPVRSIPDIAAWLRRLVEVASPPRSAASNPDL
ncbi:MAG: type II toxin-antitoxin system death-on-curing family toxin [Candidatus Anammoximicrobium sp.]|nr:type II toxin-antitoxin system death-on-curing family toxin [Candidatus Anammoximicrobium sp.]